MDTTRLMAQMERLPPTAQRMVAELIDYFSRPADAVSSWAEASAPGRPTEAILLPPLDLTDVPTQWPENRFMNPEFYGAWADRTDITDSTEFVRQLRQQQWGTK